MRQVLSLAGIGLRLHLRKIGAGAEHRTGPRELHHAHRIVIRTLPEGDGQPLDGVAVERIALRGAIEGELCDAPLEAQLDRAHTSSTAMAVASPPPMQRLAMPRFLPRALSA